PAVAVRVAVAVGVSVLALGRLEGGEYPLLEQLGRQVDARRLELLDQPRHVAGRVELADGPAALHARLLEAEDVLDDVAAFAEADDLGDFHNLALAPLEAAELHDQRDR